MASDDPGKTIWPLAPLIISLILVVVAVIWTIIQPSIGVYVLMACFAALGLSWWFALANFDQENQKTDSLDE